MPRGLGMGGPAQKLDTQDEQLFPDLAAADAMLQQKKDKPAYSVPKKTPVGGGATWGSKPKPKKEEPKPEPPQEEPAKEEPAASEETKPEPAPAATAAAPAAKAPIKPKKKKKKKDLSTFKAGN